MPRLETQLQLSRCPHCSVDSPSLHQNTNFETVNYDKKNTRIWKTYKCSRCGGVVLAACNKKSNEIIEMYPAALSLSDAIPERAKEYLDQAINSLHAPAGAIMLAASSIDAMLKEKGYENGKLYTRINKATKDHLITEGMSKWAHQVRLDANNQRHADGDVELPNEEDAKKVIEFTRVLAELLFVLPSKVDKGIEETSSEREANPEIT